jgi:hypothetical protein
LVSHGYSYFLTKGNVIEILDMNSADGAEEEGVSVSLVSHQRCKCGSEQYPSWKVCCHQNVNSTNIFLSIIGLVDPAKLKPADLLSLNKDSYLVLDTLPAEYDSRVKAMEVDEKPTEAYSDIGGLNQQIDHRRAGGGHCAAHGFLFCKSSNIRETLKLTVLSCQQKANISSQSLMTDHNQIRDIQIHSKYISALII